MIKAFNIFSMNYWENLLLKSWFSYYFQVLIYSFFPWQICSLKKIRGISKFCQLKLFHLFVTQTLCSLFIIREKNLHLKEIILVLIICSMIYDKSNILKNPSSLFVIVDQIIVGISSSLFNRITLGLSSTHPSPFDELFPPPTSKCFWSSWKLTLLFWRFILSLTKIKNIINQH